MPGQAGSKKIGVLAPTPFYCLGGRCRPTKHEKKQLSASKNGMELQPSGGGGGGCSYIRADAVTVDNLPGKIFFLSFLKLSINVYIVFIPKKDVGGLKGLKVVLYLMGSY